MLLVMKDQPSFLRDNAYLDHLTHTCGTWHTHLSEMDVRRNSKDIKALTCGNTTVPLEWDAEF